MLHIPGYQIERLIYTGGRTLVYRSRNEQSQKSVVLKTLASEIPSSQEKARLKHEFSILRNFSHPGVIQAHSLEEKSLSPILVLEDKGGKSFDQYLGGKKVELDQFFPLAFQVVQSLGYIHGQGIIHKDLHSGNLLWNSQTQRIYLIDFDLASPFSGEHPPTSLPGDLTGTATHMSPEQTGRMNRPLDYRSDYYSLGVTFYEWLTGKLPFESEDPLELSYSHIAQNPLPPREMHSSIPEGLSSVILKLLEKQAEDRYQGSDGLLQDLEYCYRQFQDTTSNFSFVLGRWDVPEQFRFPDKLFGRDKELKLLREGFERASQGKVEMMMVCGPSGVGKTALVREVLRPLFRRQGFFCSGKFDQLQRGSFYFALVQAFRELLFPLLGKTVQNLTLWKDKLTEALGPNGQVLIDLIPEWEKVIGKQPALPELGPQETKNRFHLVFQKFLSVLARPEHPIVLFLDDLQWCDPATLEWIQQILSNAWIKHLFLIGAFREEENGGKEKIKNIHSISLFPWETSDLNQLLSIAFFQKPETTLPLAEVVYRKTGGTPLFVKEFLQQSVKNKNICFSFERGAWEWDLEPLRSWDIPGGLVEFILPKLQCCSPSCQQVLGLGACLGNQFDLKTLSVIAEKLPSQLSPDLREAQNQEILYSKGDPFSLWKNFPEDFDEQVEKGKIVIPYSFQHDRLQQAAYQLIPKNERPSAHLKIGRLWKESLSGEARETRIFAILGQINQSLDLISSSEERLVWAQWNLSAGKKAKASNAYLQAKQYLQKGKVLLSKKAWEEHYDLAFSLEREIMECSFLCGEWEEAEKIVKALFEKVLSSQERAALHNFRCVFYSNEGKLEEAIREGREAVRLMGIAIPLSLGKLSLMGEMIRFGWKKKGKGKDYFLNLPQVREEKTLLLCRYLKNLSYAAYNAGKEELFGLICLKGCNFLLRKGNNEFSAYFFAALGVIHCFLGRYREAVEFGEMSCDLADRFANPEILCGVFFGHAIFLHPWKYRRKDSIPLLRKAYQAALNAGEFFLAGFIATDITNFNPSQDWKSAYEEGQAFLPLIQKAGDPVMIRLAQAFQQNRLNWMGKTPKRLSWSDENFEEEEFFNFLQSINRLPALIIFSAKKLEQCYFYGDYEQAWVWIQKMDKLVKKTNIAYEPASSTYYFYSFLTQVVLYPKKKEITRKSLRRIEKKIRVWQKECPENFDSIYWIATAEQARLFGKTKEAEIAYEKAIASSREQGFPKREALAQELAACHYQRKGFIKIAGLYMKAAFFSYQQWGALAKTSHLQENYPDLFSSFPSLTKSFSFSPDWLSMIKTSQTLSQEMDRKELLRKGLQTLKENGGAQKAFLLFPEKDGFQIQVPSEINQDEKDRKAEFSLSTAQYVARTGKTVALDDAANQGRFTQDVYIREVRPKSILCIPILHQGKLLCLLYLENNLATYAFSEDRVEVLKTLSAQIGISLENARLVDHLNRNKDELEIALKELEETHEKQNEIIEKERSRIAQELHDEAQQIFGVVKRTYRPFLDSDKQEGFDRDVERGQKAIDRTIKELYPSVLRNLGLIPELTQYINELNQERNLEVTMKVAQKNIGKLKLSEKCKINLFRIVQESLSNFYKHAETKEAEVIVLRPKPNLLWIEVSDDGKGFDPQLSTHRYGLRFMRDRAKQIGAELEILSQPEEGTTIICKLFLQEE